MPLRVKSLELQGYKTFAARTFFEFASGITAIVGPNGAGKSNLADALRWVLGEQSYSLLRGKKTEDMIFSGSEHRPRAGMASAEVMFDNDSGWLPVDYAEVAMTRRAYRDGHNDYLLNGQHVRLRDMNEVLAASGLSERTYTIVGQGLVDASLALKADERRRLFEEAAGVGLYRTRREEAIKRLETTQRNLERVEDILGEIEPRLRSLERQAKRAREYEAAQADLKETLREWYGYHWHRAQAELQEAQEKLHAAQARAAAAREEYEQATAAYGTSRSQLAKLRGDLSGWHREAADILEQRQGASLALAVLDERKSTIEASLTALGLEVEAARSKEQLARARATELEAELENSASELTQARQQLASAQSELAARHEGRTQLESNLQAAQQRAASLTTQRTELHARLDSLAAGLKYQDEQLAKSSTQIATLESQALEAQGLYAAAAERRAQSESDLEAASEALQGLRRSLHEIEDRQRVQLDEKTAVEARATRLKVEIEVLDQAEAALSGYADGTRMLLEAARDSRLQIKGALTSMLDLPQELETAVAAALGDSVDAILLDGPEVEKALDLLESEGTGRAALLALDGGADHALGAVVDPDLLGVASELVSVDPALRAAVKRLLGDTLVVRTRAAARRLLRQIPSGARIVTLGGAVYRTNGLILAGRSNAPSRLSRPRQRREFLVALDEMGEHLRGLEAGLQQTETAVGALSRRVEEGEAELTSARVSQQSAMEAEQKAGLEIERIQKLLEWHKARHDDMLEERATAERERGLLLSSLGEQETLAQAATREMTKLAEQLSLVSLEQMQEHAAYWATRTAVAEQNVNGLHVRRADQDAIVELASRAIEELEERRLEIVRSLRQIEDERSALLLRQSELQSQVDAIQGRIRPVESELEAAEKTEAALEVSETTTQKDVSSAERIQNQFEIELIRRQEALDSLRSRVIDDFGLVSFEYASSVEGPVPLPFEGLVEQLPQISELRDDLEMELAQRRARVRRLGLINPEAAREYEAESERYSFLSAQVKDLRQAEEDLRQVIGELDELTRREFLRTYTAVDREFRSIFTRLFGGGSAHLSLTDPDDLVETGIEIQARLPGRREQGLSLLSGGERSLTAIALVFALLKVSPTPVCVMDEVDAMLDEANVGRFRDLLKELSQETQFVIITHNRNTVQAADFIYGVTMGRDSTSQVISLRLDEVSEEMLGSGRN